MLRREFLGSAIVPMVGSSLFNKPAINRNLELITDIMLKKVQLTGPVADEKKEYDVVIHQKEWPDYDLLQNNKLEVEGHWICINFLNKERREYKINDSIEISRVTFSSEQLRDVLRAKLSNYFTDFGIIVRSISFEYTKLKT